MRPIADGPVAAAYAPRRCGVGRCVNRNDRRTVHQSARATAAHSLPLIGCAIDFPSKANNKCLPKHCVSAVVPDAGAIWHALCSTARSVSSGSPVVNGCPSRRDRPATNAKQSHTARMVRLFNHWFASNTLLQVVFDAILLFLSVVLAVAFLHRGELLNLEAVVPDALLFALTMVALNTRRRALPAQSRANDGADDGAHRAVAAAGGSGRVGHLHLPAARRSVDRNAAAGGPARLRDVSSRSAASSRTAAWRRCSRAGRWCWAPAPRRSRSSSRSAIWARRSGFSASSRRRRPRRRIRCAGNRILAGGMDLVDAARRYNVDEIIVAVRERRGGVLPLRELLDCKLMGVRVLDLSSYYERAVGQLRLDSLHASWLIFGDGFRQGYHAHLRQARVRHPGVVGAAAAGRAGDAGHGRGDRARERLSRSSTGRNGSGRAAACST